ncbi:unnamed protein product [Lampetra fluviatilis]
MDLICKRDQGSFPLPGADNSGERRPVIAKTRSLMWCGGLERGDLQTGRRSEETGPVAGGSFAHIHNVARKERTSSGSPASTSTLNAANHPATRARRNSERMGSTSYPEQCPLPSSRHEVYTAPTCQWGTWSATCPQCGWRDRSRNSQGTGRARRPPGASSVPYVVVVVMIGGGGGGGGGGTCPVFLLRLSQQWGSCVWAVSRRSAWLRAAGAARERRAGLDSSRGSLASRLR